MAPPFAGKFRSICMKNWKHDFSLLSKLMLFRFNRLTLLANIVSLQFTEMSEYQPSSSYRASKSRFFPYIHCKFCRVCPTTKMSSATVKSSIVSMIQSVFEFRFMRAISVLSSSAKNALVTAYLLESSLAWFKNVVCCFETISCLVSFKKGKTVALKETVNKFSHS